MSGIPGPWSRKVSRKPPRAPFSRSSSVTVPPPPCWRVLRASSLAAVMMRVWSTRLKRSCSAFARTACRTATTCSPERICRRSDGPFLHSILPPPGYLPQQFHSLLDVQGRPYPTQGDSKFHQSNGYRRPHADNHRGRIQYPGNGGNVAEHSPDEGIHNFEGRNVDQDA